MQIVTDEEAGAAPAAAARAATIAALALVDTDAPSDVWKAVNGLAVAAGTFALAPGDFGAGLVSAWRLVALHGEPAALAATLPAEIGGRMSDAAGGRVRAAEIAALIAAFALACCRVAYESEQDAATARATLARVAAPAIELAGTVSADLCEWLSRLTGEAALALSRLAATRAPLVRVETGVSLSAIRLAHDLYGDANRAGELVARNRAATAAMMPTAIEALSR